MGCLPAPVVVQNVPARLKIDLVPSEDHWRASQLLTAAAAVAEPRRCPVELSLDCRRSLGSVGLCLEGRGRADLAQCRLWGLKLILLSRKNNAFKSWTRSLSIWSEVQCNQNPPTRHIKYFFVLSFLFPGLRVHRTVQVSKILSISLS